MSSLRSQPLDLDSQLLMYAAGELPADEAQALAGRLAQEPDLNEQLRQVRDAVADTDRRLGTLDDCNGLAYEHAARRAVGAIRAWQLVRPAASTAPRPLLQPQRRWGVASSVAAVIAIGLGVAGMITYLNPPQPPRAAQTDDLPFGGGESIENPLALHAATSLAIGLEIDDELAASPMPPTDETLVSSEQSFFEVPLIADADDRTQ